MCLIQPKKKPKGVGILGRGLKKKKEKQGAG
jgi:hypothetical protein